MLCYSYAVIRYLISMVLCYLLMEDTSLSMWRTVLTCLETFGSGLCSLSYWLLIFVLIYKMIYSIDIYSCMSIQAFAIVNSIRMFEKLPFPL